MSKFLAEKSNNTKFLSILIDDIFFSKNHLFRNDNSTYPFYSSTERSLKKKLVNINDQRCLGYVKTYIENDDLKSIALKGHREQGNLKARLIKNYNLNDELIIINTAGGLTSGDLNISSLKVANNVNLCISTQSMEKIYKCKNHPAHTYTNLSVGKNSYVLWMPFETIFFNGGKLRRRINIDLDKKSNFLGIETLVFGRKAMGEVVNRGSLDDAWQIYLNGKLLYSDFNRISGNINQKLSNTLVLKGKNIFCNVVYKGKKNKTYKKKILKLIKKSTCFAGVSIINEVLVLKVLAEDIIEIRNFLENLMDIFDDNFNIPKIWSL